MADVPYWICGGSASDGKTHIDESSDSRFLRRFRLEQLRFRFDKCGRRFSHAPNNNLKCVDLYLADVLGRSTGSSVLER